MGRLTALFRTADETNRSGRNRLSKAGCRFSFGRLIGSCAWLGLLGAANASSDETTRFQIDSSTMNVLAETIFLSETESTPLRLQLRNLEIRGLAASALLPPGPAADITYPTASADGGASNGTRLQLSLQDLVHTTVARNVAAENARLEIERAQAERDGEQGLYEPTFFLGLTYTNRNRLRTEQEQNPLLGTILQELGQQTDPDPRFAVLDERVGELESGFRGPLPSGAEWEVGYSLSQRQLNILPDQREDRGRLILQFRQPLLRGFGRTNTEAALRIAALGVEAAQAQYISQLNDRVAETAIAYWSLYRAMRVHEIQREAFANSRALQQDVTQRVRRGVAPSTDALDAAINVAEREADLARSLQGINEALANLSNLLNTGGLVQQIARIELLDSAHAERLTEDQLLDLRLDRALAESPSIRSLQAQREQEQIRLLRVRDDERPRLDLSASYATDSLAYNNRSESAREAFSTRHPDWTVGLRLEVPIRGNVRARAATSGQAVRVVQFNREIEAERQRITTGIEARWSQLQQSFAELDRVRTAVTLSTERLAIEWRRYELGVSRLADVFIRQGDVIENRRREVESAARLEIARAVLLQAEGRLLETYDVNVNW